MNDSWLPLDQEKLKIFQRKLLRWFKKHGRTFPWRKTRDPYRVIVAEMLLQKTNVEKVVPVYRKILKTYPSVKALASADINQIEKLIQPLGLLYRAVRLKRMAEGVVEDHSGRFPHSEKELNRLYGVGDYMTNAVRAFAYGEPVPIVDTNVIRLFARVFALKSRRPRARTDRQLWEQIGKAVPKKRGRDFNLAILDFAALVCTDENPKCPTCPMKSFCRYYDEAYLAGP